MNKAIFPMNTISISQRFHDAHLSWDMNSDDTGADEMFAPFDCHVVRVLPYDETGFYNTIIVNSVEPVLCEDGVERYLTMSLTHMNDEDFALFDYKVGQLFQQYDILYKEGTKGFASGNHIHMTIAHGLYDSYTYLNNQYVFPRNSLYITVNGKESPLIANTFYRRTWHTIRNANGYTFALDTDEEPGSEIVSCDEVIAKLDEIKKDVIELCESVKKQ